MSITPEQVVNEIKRRGGFDAMRQEMYSHFISSDKGAKFEKLVKDTLESIQDRSPQLISNTSHLEHLLLEELNKEDRFDQVSKEARIHWLANKDNRLRVSQSIKSAIDQVKQKQQEPPKQ